MRKFALIAIRKSVSHSWIFVNLNDCQRTVYMNFHVFHSLFTPAYLALLYPLCRVSTAKYHERDKWKAERLSFTCQIPFLVPATNIATNCCPKDPFNPRDTRQFRFLDAINKQYWLRNKRKTTYLTNSFYLKKMQQVFYRKKVLKKSF